MQSLLRIVRGTLGMGVAWAAAWALVFAALAAIAGLVDPASIDPGEGLIRVGAIGAVFGFVSGTAFAVLLSWTEARRAIRSLSLGRAAVWGALATAIYPLATVVDNSMVFLVSPIGASLAAAAVAAAQRADRRTTPTADIT